MPACPSWSTAMTHYPLRPGRAGAVARALRRSRTASTSSAAAAAPRRRTSRRSTRCCGGSARRRRRGPAPQARAAGLGAGGRLALRPGARCARRTPTCRSASAATPTARANSASCRSRATGTAASRWAREQVKEGSHALDVCTAFVGRDEVAEMTEVVTPHARRGQRAAGHRFDRVAGARSGAASSMAASRSSTRSISRMARRRPTSGWNWRAGSAPR